MDLDVAEVLDFKILCVRREGACSEREESSSLVHAPRFHERTHGDQHLEGLNARRFLDLASRRCFFYFGVFSKGRARPPPAPPLLSPFLSSREVPSCLRQGRVGHFASKKGKEKGGKICCHRTLA